jgi:hypothetical protein
MTARQIDLSDDAAPDNGSIVRLHDFPYKFMTGRAAETVVSALQFEIGVANPCIQQANQSETLRPHRPADLAYTHTAIFEVYG